MVGHYICIFIKLDWCWFLIYFFVGTGIIRRGIFMSSSYCVALGNLNEEAEVLITAMLYLLLLLACYSITFRKWISLVKFLHDLILCDLFSLMLFYHVSCLGLTSLYNGKRSHMNKSCENFHERIHSYHAADIVIILVFCHWSSLLTWLDILLEQVELNLRVKASLYNTTNAYYKCALTSSTCSLSTSFHDGNTAVLVSPGPQQVRLVCYTCYKEKKTKYSSTKTF